jgi:phosphoglycerate dehydrogenase-like enzyme
VVIATDDAAFATALARCDALYANPPTRVDEACFARAPRLRVVAAGGAGLDHIDVAAAARHGVAVLSAGDAGAASVAEHTIGVMVALAKRLIDTDAAVRAGNFDIRWQLPFGELSGKTLGILGFGNIGRAIAARATAFDMRVLATTRVPTELPGAFANVTLEELLAESDFVSVNVPLTRSTRSIIGATELALMRPGTYLINTSRGGVVDDAALAAALHRGHLAGAAVDVFENEPPVGNPLLDAPNVVLTPHNAGITSEAIRRMAHSVADRIADALESDERSVGV